MNSPCVGAKSHFSAGIASASETKLSSRTFHTTPTDFATLSTTGRVTWTVVPTRLYRLEHSDGATNGAPWVDSGLGVIAPGAGPTLTREAAVPATPTRFFRAKAVVPLAP